jgi:hypothetical protein
MCLTHLTAAIVRTVFALCALAFMPAPSVSLAPALTTEAAAQGLDYREAGKAPPSWMQFAKLVKYRFETWLMADEPVANRFRSYVVDHAGKQDGPPPTIVVRAWLNPDGSVERVTFPPLPDPDADDDLHAILKRGNVGEAPPPEMLQPLNLSFSLNPKK